MTTLRVELPPEVVEQIVTEVVRRVLDVLGDEREPESPYLTVKEAAEYLRCKRQRIDDLLSSHRLTRYKDGSRTLVARAELVRYVESSADGSRP